MFCIIIKIADCAVKHINNGMLCWLSILDVVLK